jgi:hypothetical protein
MSFTFHAGLAYDAAWRVDYLESDLGKTFTAPAGVARNVHVAMHSETRHGGYFWTMSVGSETSSKQTIVYQHLIGMNGSYADTPDRLVHVSGPADGISQYFQVQGLTMSVSPWVQLPNGKWSATQTLNLLWNPTPEPSTTALAVVAVVGVSWMGRFAGRTRSTVPSR